MDLKTILYPPYVPPIQHFDGITITLSASEAITIHSYTPVDIIKGFPSMTLRMLVWKIKQHVEMALKATENK